MSPPLITHSYLDCKAHGQGHEHDEDMQNHSLMLSAHLFSWPGLSGDSGAAILGALEALLLLHVVQLPQRQRPHLQAAR